MTKIWMHTLGAATALLLSAASIHAAALFAPLDETAAAKALATDPAYRALAGDPALAALRLVAANPQALSDKASRITLNLGPGQSYTAQLVESYRTDGGLLVWSGVIADPGARLATADGLQFDPTNTVMLVRNGDKITGNVHFDGEWYQIRPLHASGHAIARVDASRMPPDHPPAYKDLPSFPMPAAAVDKLDKANTVITVMVNYTPAVKLAVGDVAGLITLAVAESNQGYANSGITITLQLVSSAQVTYTESGDFNTDLTRYRGTADGYMDTIHAARNTAKADVAVLLITNTAYCGLASGIGSTATTAFATVYYGCATGYYSFAHEIGHLQSARHDPANDPSASPYTYGHGYQYTGSPKWRTIMAYDCTGGCPRLKYWSNPAILYSGHPMGTAATSNNAKVLNATRATVAAFR
jgi:hypothetical protein